MEVRESLRHNTGLTPMNGKGKEGGLAKDSSKKTSISPLWSPPAKLAIRSNSASQQLAGCIRTLLSQITA